MTQKTLRERFEEADEIVALIKSAPLATDPAVARVLERLSAMAVAKLEGVLDGLVNSNRQKLYGGPTHTEGKAFEKGAFGRAGGGGLDATHAETVQQLNLAEWLEDLAAVK
jgi:hypothetical protein